VDVFVQKACDRLVEERPTPGGQEYGQLWISSDDVSCRRCHLRVREEKFGSVETAEGFTQWKSLVKEQTDGKQPGGVASGKFEQISTGRIEDERLHFRVSRNKASGE
jgi:hypothetical protein